MLSWSLEYRSWSAPKWVLRALVVHRFTPWILAHLVALPLAIAWVYRVARTAGSGNREERPGMGWERGLLGCFYLSWLLQADLLQHGTPYHHVPALFLALAVAACWYDGKSVSRGRWATLLLFAAVAVGLHPALKWPRLSAWGQCFLREGDAELKNRLALTDTTDWQNLERVARFLRAQSLRDGELNCYGTYTIPLYLRLHLQPATRFIQFDFVLAMFPGRRQTVYAEANRSPQRYVVSDVKDGWAVGLARAEVGDQASDLSPVLPPTSTSPAASRYPWSEEIVFRAGRYCVHKLTGRTP
jgi:hypothetical protein